MWPVLIAEKLTPFMARGRHYQHKDLAGEEREKFRCKGSGSGKFENAKEPVMM